MERPNAVFVYGTLKKSHLRGGLWPRRPVRIDRGIIRADLYDLGPYPAVEEGDGWVLGEIWQFVPADMPETLAVLDAIEGYDPRNARNEYVRRLVNVSFDLGDSANHQESAYAYFMGTPEVAKKARKISPTIEFQGQLVAAWPDALSRIPQSLAEE